MNAMETVEKIALNRCKPGEYVRLSDKPNARTYRKGPYDREWKAFSLTACDDNNAEIFKKSKTLVFRGFTY